jgi:hypothetical protein
MKSIRFVFFALFALLVACNNMPPDDTAPFKAYPNPYNPSQGTLTIEKTSGSAFDSADHHDLVVLDFGLNEVYRTTVIPTTTAPTGKIYWTGIDNGGTKVAPGIYYLKVITSKSTGVEGADAMFKLVVQ